MGQVIRRDAPAHDILADVQLTRERAASRGGLWASLASAFLDETLAAIGPVLADLAAANRAESAAKTQLSLIEREVHLEVGGYYYELWQHLGRPAYDLHLQLLFPSGPKGLTGVATEAQPERLRTLAGLLAEHTHPRLPHARCDAIAAELRDLAKRTADVHAAWVTARSRQGHHESLLRPMAIAAHAQLSNLKRTLLAHNLRQTEIHEVIPARPRVTKGRRAADAALELPSQPPAELPVELAPELPSEPEERPAARGRLISIVPAAEPVAPAEREVA